MESPLNRLFYTFKVFEEGQCNDNVKSSYSPARCLPDTGPGFSLVFSNLSPNPESPSEDSDSHKLFPFFRVLSIITSPLFVQHLGPPIRRLVSGAGSYTTQTPTIQSCSSYSGDTDSEAEEPVTPEALSLKPMFTVSLQRGTNSHEYSDDKQKQSTGVITIGGQGFRLSGWRRCWENSSGSGLGTDQGGGGECYPNIGPTDAPACAGKQDMDGI
ncbi:hypothetical protein BT96DRAFT_999458 [Gymnopus androsaceus JB14]|uniref:Uncharacterized protein n=1 Tax=Gymnopus androsaceus JB14 TaxID=1447944 RepID=A0A6A4H6S2_9AGAR|nr:hypothetical protein BT96DRAFT_999458 [Gymnopus androsaceus JB14]